MEITKFYGGADPREAPLYSVREAARFIRVAPSTLSSWVQRTWRPPGGKRDAPPIIRLPDPEISRLSFNNLVEAFVLRMLRRSEGLTMPRVQKAVWNAREERGVERPFLSKQLAASGDLFWEDGEFLFNLNMGNQLGIRQILDQYLTRVDWDDENDVPARLYPVISDLRSGDTIVIDPMVCFGQPTIKETGIITSVILDRVNAGDPVKMILRDYGISQAQLSDAVLYETTKG